MSQNEWYWGRRKVWEPGQPTQCRAQASLHPSHFPGPAVHQRDRCLGTMTVTLQQASKTCQQEMGTGLAGVGKVQDWLIECLCVPHTASCFTHGISKPHSISESRSSGMWTTPDFSGSLSGISNLTHLTPFSCLTKPFLPQLSTAWPSFRLLSHP